MKIRKISCPYCNIFMEYTGTYRIQLGGTNTILLHRLPTSIYECPRCGKLEFFRFKKTKRKKDDTVADI
jgi:DNA-directed RNA polymerase subunit RPC12/RpoP